MKSSYKENGESPKAVWNDEGGAISLKVSGEWRTGKTVDMEGNEKAGWPETFDTDDLGGFDSSLPAYLLRKLRESDVEGEPSVEGMREDLKGLMELALKVPERSDAKGQEDEVHGLRFLGKKSTEFWQSLMLVLEFTGDTVLATGRFFVGKARFRASDFWVTVQECGIGALPIVSLISFLIGMILAFVGNVQLANFGASLYVADLVGIAMLREMGVMMTAIIMSGRTGAAFAAHIGSMNANQEIDALKTFGINPFDYLVLPRVFALVLMMPILTIYSNTVGILGGMLVGAGVGIPPSLFWAEMLTAIDMTQASLGVMKSLFFGVAIAISGCLQGMNSGGSSAAVGQATTKAVVASITMIIVLDSAFAVIFTILEI
ncbi:MlaE family ABC transporter permease [Luteolibacter sp. AS25]|uniref:MlaE family ABC transporter permease n=1 Tax=Luteolibacter sp. AS25 TaxID=3135776 RepID=UPI00398B105B